MFQISCCKKPIFSEKETRNLEEIWELSHYTQCDSNSIILNNYSAIEFTQNKMIYMNYFDSTKIEYATYALKKLTSDINKTQIKPLVLNYDIYNEVGGKYDTLFIKSISSMKMVFNESIQDTCFTYYLNKKK